MKPALADIQIPFECFEPFGHVTVLASRDGSHIMLLDALENEIYFDDVSSTDRDRIKWLVKKRAKALKEEKEKE